MRKQLFIYGLCLLVLWPGWRSALIGVWYQANRQYIATELCLNRTRPELQCHGKCILMQRLQAHQEQERQGLLLDLEDLLTKNLVFIPTSITVLVLGAMLPAATAERRPWQDHPYASPSSRFFRPPKLPLV